MVISIHNLSDYPVHRETNDYVYDYGGGGLNKRTTDISVLIYFVLLGNKTRCQLNNIGADGC